MLKNAEPISFGFNCYLLKTFVAVDRNKPGINSLNRTRSDELKCYNVIY